MTTKHTAGPWQYRMNHPACIPAADIFDTSGCPIPGSCMMVAYLGDTGTPGQAEANARLMAAAPDLLAALKRAMDAVETYHETVGSKSTGDDLAACRAAIAKAEGEVGR